jgi:hypothetical protein
VIISFFAIFYPLLDFFTLGFEPLKAFGHSVGMASEEIEYPPNDIARCLLSVVTCHKFQL